MPLWRFGLRASFWFIVLCIPVLGLWLGGSVAAMWNGPRWVAWVAGALWFPLGPVLWEVVARVRARASQRPAYLTLGDRLLLRTLALNVPFLAAWMYFAPGSALTAVATRGDWMLDGVQAPWADRARGAFATVADALQDYNADFDNEWVSEAESDTERRPDPSEVKPVAPRRAPVPVPEPEPSAEPDPEPRPAPADPLMWPIDPQPHPLATQIVGESVREIGEAIRAQTSSERERARVVHDWVALHVDYDFASLEPGQRKPQDADTVLRSGLGVCAGYANLVVALSKAAGLDAVFIVGNVRDDDGSLAGTSHAWNAVKVDGQWLLMDVTWDKVSDGKGGEARYRTDYLFTPPEVFRYDHLPEIASWQLHDTPISKGDFMRQPLLQASFFASGMTLLDPQRSTIDAHDTVVVTLRNPKRRSVLAQIGEERCDVSGTSEVSVRCKVPRSGRHRLVLFDNAVPRGTHRSVASWIVHGT